MGPHEKILSVEVSKPDPEAEFFADWGLETFKRNLTFVNETLRSVMTLSSALAGGSVVFGVQSGLSPSARVIAGFLFFAALIVSLVGVLPYHGQVDLRVPADIRQHKETALRLKLCCVWVAAFLIVLGLFAALIGLLLPG
jgi:hypothetical protein